MTEGWVARNKFALIPKEWHPYSTQLQLLFDDRASVVQYGLSGEKTCDMAKRLRTILEDRVPNDMSWNFICILGGTNDLSLNSPETIFKNLSSMYELAAPDQRVVAVTIPETGHSPEESQMIRRLCETRIAVNERIRVYSREHNILTVDLEQAMPNLSTSKENRETDWSDMLHMTAAGYDKFAEHVFEVISPHLK